MYVGADRYQDASEIVIFAHTRFRRATRPDSATFVFAVNQSGRRNQYDLWPRFPDVARPGDDLLLVLDDGDDFHSSARRLAPFFVRGARRSYRAGPRRPPARRAAPVLAGAWAARRMARAGFGGQQKGWWRATRAPDANDRTSHQRRATRDTTMTISTDLDPIAATRRARWTSCSSSCASRA